MKIRQNRLSHSSKTKIGTLVKFLYIFLVLLTSANLSGCGYNDIQRQDEAVTAAWSEVINQYQRRADLVPNLVNATKGYMAHEEKILIEVAQARAKVGNVQINALSLHDPAILQQFQTAQGELSNALSRLMVVSERYPNLKADSLFQNLQAQVEGSENRVTIARNRYVQEVQQYNTLIRIFPNNLMASLFGYDVKPNFTVENEKKISHSPTVNFGDHHAPITN
ncbi:LemA family protein [Vibrio anguillarum]|nr:LemA family protein [Vibrio anguillarum]MBF4295802.1 LemA family protein [Vibrio anguillarum]